MSGLVTVLEAVRAVDSRLSVSRRVAWFLAEVAIEVAVEGLLVTLRKLRSRQRKGREDEVLDPALEEALACMARDRGLTLDQFVEEVLHGEDQN